MLISRPSAARGHAHHGWLEARHSFSFAEYYDPEEMGWGVLRVINEDRVAPDSGFPTHGHRDMEIVTWVLSGQLEHKDSLGNGGVLGPGEPQAMSAGRGILHSEFNPSPDTECHLLQIWIQPARRGDPCRYAQQALDPVALSQRLVAVASPDGRDGSLVIGQDAVVYATRLVAGESRDLPSLAGRLGYLQVAKGSVSLNGQPMAQGDGMKIADEAALQVRADSDAEIVFFDLPPQ